MTDHPDDLLDALQRQGVARLWAEAAAKKRAGRGPKLPSKPKRKHEEQDRQDSIVLFIRRHARVCRVAQVRNHTVPPPGLTDEQRIYYFQKLKRGGLWAGHPDLNIYLPGGRLSLWETKTPIGRLSKAQELCHADLRALGHDVRVVLDVTEAQVVLRELGVLDNQPPPFRIAAPVQPMRGMPVDPYPLASMDDAE